MTVILPILFVITLLMIPILIIIGKNSKAKDSNNVPVDYTYVKYVSKPKGAKPGMVIFVNNKTLYVTPKTPM